MEIKRRQRDEREQQRTAVKERIQAALVLLINHLAFAVIALLLGSFTYVLAYADLGLGESWLARAIVAALFFFLCGFGLGFFNPDGWIIAGLTAWGCVILGVLSLVSSVRPRESIGVIPQEPPFIYAGLILLFIPAGLALVGGYIGKTVSRRRNAEGREVNG